MYRIFPIPGTERRAVAERAINYAREQEGYTAGPNRTQVYGPDGLPWDGEFIDRVLYRVGVRGPDAPSHAKTASALQWYILKRRAYREPKPGDIAFFPNGFAQPKVGLVTETDRWYTHGEFSSVDAETDSGLPLSRTTGLKDGVYEKQHFGTDALIFGRPDFGARMPKNPRPARAIGVRPAHFVPGKSHRSVERIQYALHQTVGLNGNTRGKWDRKTVSAYRLWQRTVGVTDTGHPDLESLDALRIASGSTDWIVAA